MKIVRYSATFYESDGFGASRAKYVAGEFYAESEETLRHIAGGIADSVEVTDLDADTAAARAAKAMAKATAAVQAAQDAELAAAAAQAAERIAAEPAAAEPAAAEPAAAEPAEVAQ